MISKQALDEILSEWFNLQIELSGGKTTLHFVSRSEIVDTLYKAIVVAETA